uniref:MARVEL domain-containing protein n=1 Tax=Chelonoidis abingdonii TaxID=106734 RepID=A0A8C0JBW6_CHEAB
MRGKRDRVSEKGISKLLSLCIWGLYMNFIFSIFAFATCGGYSGHTSIKVSCPDTKNETLEAAFGYPFRLNTVVFKELDSKKCNNTWTTTHLVGDFSSSAQFFVTFAVFVFLYCMAALVLYVGYLHLYRGAGKLPMIDLVITMVIALLWLISTSAWAKALTDIKISTGSEIMSEILFCHLPPNSCLFGAVSSMGSLNVSVVCMYKCWRQSGVWGGADSLQPPM